MQWSRLGDVAMTWSRSFLLALSALMVIGPVTSVEPKRDRHGDLLPEGTVARLGTVHAHPDANQIRFSADGRTIITTSNAIVRYWDAETGRVRRLKARPVNFEDASQVISADGCFAATVIEGRLEVHDLERDELLHRLTV